MKNDIVVFSNPEFGKIRTIKIDGEPFFMAKDVCDTLDLSDVSMTVKRLDDDEKLTQVVFVSGQHRDMWFISESGLYALIFQSRKPFARAFRKWVTSEVLPTIRKTGGYKVAYPYEKRIKHLERLREIDRNRLEILQSWILNIQAERDVYCDRFNSCTEIIHTRVFSESENRVQLGKLLKSIRSGYEISVSTFSKQIGENFSKSILMDLEQGKENVTLSSLFKVLAGLGYSIQLVKND